MVCLQNFLGQCLGDTKSLFEEELVSEDLVSGGPRAISMGHRKPGMRIARTSLICFVPILSQDPLPLSHFRGGLGVKTQTRLLSSRHPPRGDPAGTTRARARRWLGNGKDTPLLGRQRSAGGSVSSCTKTPSQKSLSRTSGSPDSEEVNSGG